MSYVRGPVDGTIQTQWRNRLVNYVNQIIPISGMPTPKQNITMSEIKENIYEILHYRLCVAKEFLLYLTNGDTGSKFIWCNKLNKQ